jgi:suppressor for copper-sensitivity B
MIRLFLVMILLVFPAQARALSGAWVEDKVISARLVSEVEAVGNEEIIPLGLEIKLAKEWHTYWRSPGQAGVAPHLDWSESANVKSAEIFYPAPHRYTVYGLETVGYRDRVVFPLDVTVFKKGQPVEARVGVDLLLCYSICLPKHLDLKLSLPQGAATEAPEARLLEEAREAVPGDSEDSGIVLRKLASDGQSLTFEISSRDRLIHPDIFIENDKNIGFGAPDVKIDRSGLNAVLKVRPVDTVPPDVALSKLPLTLTIVNGDHATEIQTQNSAVLPSPPPFTPAKPSLGVLLLFALLGGFILNFMPCVLPVLSLKVVGALRHGGCEEETHVRLSFLLTGAGVVFSFFVLASAMVVLKSFGLSLGWGVQFQQPAFLMFLVLLLTFFAANLWGLYEIVLPAWLAEKLEGSYHTKLAGDFATGAFATLLATPCSAPFLGTAVGFALSQGPTEIFSIFLLLGLGMSLPYLLVAFFPRTAMMLPKPGVWMVALRFAMGLALAATAAWLVWVMMAQISTARALAFGAMMGAIILVLALRPRLSQRLALASVILLSLAGLTMGLGVHGSERPRTAQIERRWMAYNPATLRAGIAEGKTVFLDVVADWCLTCKANASYALADEDVSQRLFHSDVVAMQANWTSPDSQVAELLHKYGRYGIPFTIVFGPGAPQGVILPELLTPALVLDALKQASTPKASSSQLKYKGKAGKRGFSARRVDQAVLPPGW